MALNEKQTDLARLWDEALDKYNGFAKVDIRALLSNKKSASSIVMEQQHQLESFGGYRHDRKKLDKLRSFISSNADIIQIAAVQIASAASAAFPPSSAVLTAFTCVMTASKHVSEDYDMIEGFFDVMHSFISRLSLLENKIPVQTAFQRHLINVFSSLLVLTGLARSYCLKGRFTKWAKALIDGKDPELQDAYSALHENLRRLESAVMLQTLRTTIEIKEEAMSASQGIKTLQAQSKELQLSLNINTTYTEKTLSISTETNSDVKQLVQLGRSTAEGNQELLLRSESIAKTLETMRKMHSKERETKERSLRSGAVKPANFERLKKELGWPAERRMLERQHDLEVSAVDGIFDWIQNDESFSDFADGELPFLQVVGASGMGKSTLAFKIFRLLKDKHIQEPATCVAAFFFDEEHDEMKSAANMIRWCAVKAAEKDSNYCEKALVELRQNDYSLGDDVVWGKLIKTKYGKGSDRKLVLILDGIDENEEDEVTKLLHYFSEVKSEGLKVQIVITSDASRDSEMSALEAKRIDLVKSKVGRDMQRLVWHRIRTQPRLQKLRVGLRKFIIRKVAKQADSFLYVEHIMRRLNSLGREGLILKELENLPTDIKSLYETILAECTKNRNSDERELLRSLFAWLAYAKSRLTVGEANILIDMITTEMSISIEEELDGRLSRLLRVSGNGDKDVGDADSSENELEQVVDEDTESAAQRANDADNLLGFQERSLRAYFRRPSDDPDGLRSTSTQAHVTIFSMVSAILSKLNKSESTAAQSLTQYAANWAFIHLLEISLDSVNDRQAAMVLESLFNLLSNKNDALKPMEELTEGNSTIFTLQTKLEDVLKALSTWSKRALTLPSTSISYEAINFYRPLVQEPYRVFVPLSRAHINNWFAARWILDAYAAFGCAHFSLEQGQKLPELRQNQVLREYYEEYAKSRSITQRSFEIISNVFWDVAKTSAVYMGIGMAMKNLDLYEAAIGQLDLGLCDGSIDDVVRFGLLSSKGSAFLFMGSKAEPGEKREQLLSKSLESLNLALEAYDNLTEAEKEKTDHKSGAAFNYEDRAKALALTGKFDAALQDIKSSLNINPEYLIRDIVPDLVSACATAHEPAMIMKILQALPPRTLGRYFLASESKNVQSAQEAAKRSGEGAALVELYNSTAKFLGTLQPPIFGDSIAALHLDAAIFSRSALGEDGKAREYLQQLMNDPKSDAYWVKRSCDILCEQNLEDFRRSNNPIAKKTALEDTKKLLGKLSEVLGNDFKAAESTISLVMAGMLRKLGPALEWQDVLQAAFQSCVENLSDDVGWNDSYSFRRLTRVLMSVDGMEKQAQVALTAQLYVIDAEVRKNDLAKQALIENGPVTPRESREDSGRVDNQSEAVPKDSVAENNSFPSTGQVDKSNTSAEDGVNSGPPPPATTTSAEAKSTTATASLGVASGKESSNVESGDDMSEGLLGSDGFSCNYCGEDVVDWAHGAAYLCLSCTDCDICEVCFDKRAAQFKGESEADWRVICPRGHKHVRAPIEGWRGVKDGKLRIGGDEIPFRDWLRDVEDQWKAYWDRYWVDADDLV